MASSTSTHVEDSSQQLRGLRDHADELRAIGGAISLMAWDERTKLPARGAAWRARQLGVLSGILHAHATSPRLDAAIAAVEDEDPDNVEARVMRRDFDLATRLPAELVRRNSEATSLAQHAWREARANDDFTAFAPHLQEVLDIARERAECYGYETERYDALHDLYEQGSRAAQVEPVFAQLREPLQRLVDAQPEVDTSLLAQRFPLDAQKRFGAWLVGQMGYDLEAGRIDATAHPFCIGIGAGDVRLTTRYDEHWLPGALWSTIHEAGHGIYEQAFDRLGLPSTIGEPPGLGMHESQSRMYENVIGRSQAFWEHFYPELQRSFPDALGATDVQGFLAAVSAVRRSLIRTESDELTYNLHVAARFELERALVNGTLSVDELPEAWNDAYHRWLGIRPESDADGVLQDVHWSGGSFGYFPTYTLGNVYAAQFVERARADIPGLEQQWREGRIRPLRDWFDEHVYRHGRTYTGRELVQRITGGPVDSTPLIRYLEQRFDASA